MAAPPWSAATPPARASRAPRRAAPADPPPSLPSTVNPSGTMAAGGQSMVLRIALLGSGFVSELYMLGLDEVRGHDVVVNYSRSAKPAREFGQRCRIPHQSTDLGAAIQRHDAD